MLNFSIGLQNLYTGMNAVKAGRWEQCIYSHQFHQFSQFAHKSKIKILCPSHGMFTQLPWGHLKYGCRSCNVHKSKIEKEWLKSLSIPALVHQYKIPGTSFTVDGFDPVTNTVYEFYGDYWHGNPKKFLPSAVNTRTPKQKTFGQLYLDTLSREQAIKDAGFAVVTIWESDYRLSR